MSVMKDNVCGGFRVLADRLDEVYSDLSTPQLTALLATLNQAWSVVERRENPERRTNHVR